MLRPNLNLETFVIFIPGELEDSTLGIGTAGDHIDVLERVCFFLSSNMYLCCFQ